MLLRLLASYLRSFRVHQETLFLTTAKEKGGHPVVTYECCFVLSSFCVLKKQLIFMHRKKILNAVFCCKQRQFWPQWEWRRQPRRRQWRRCRRRKRWAQVGAITLKVEFDTWIQMVKTKQAAKKKELHPGQVLWLGAPAGIFVWWWSAFFLNSDI